MIDVSVYRIFDLLHEERILQFLHLKCTESHVLFIVLIVLTLLLAKSLDHPLQLIIQKSVGLYFLSVFQKCLLFQRLLFGLDQLLNCQAQGGSFGSC